jgi:hypothetical protein
MNFKYKAAWSKSGRLPDHQEEEAGSFEAALARAQQAAREGAKVATVLRADTDGINTGKFFLHHIVK